MARGAAAPAAGWVELHGRLVDISRFDHPGGNVIDFFDGLDATTAFESFHGHHKAAKLVLASLPEKTLPPHALPPQPEEHAAEMSRLIAAWRARGLYEPRPLAGIAYGLAVIAAIGASLALSPRAPLLCGVLLGVAWAHCGFLQHMGGHRAWGARYSLLFQHFFEGLCKGGSATWWRNRHNKHHAKTNVIGEDGDLRTTPFFAWDPTLAKKVPDWSLRTQAFTFLPALGAYVFVFAFTVRKYAVVKKLWHEVSLMVLHYALFIAALASAGHSLRSGLAYYCTGYAVQGIYLGFFFGLSHFAAERVPRTATWLESSMHGTVDWSGGSAFFGYLSGFLNVQIEHHMAPQMPMENLRLIRDDCKAVALKMGLPYRELSFGGAVAMMLRGLRDTGRCELRLRADRKKYSRAQAVMGAAGAVVETLKAD
mmetsp:Transcript_30147/g.75332  ORF Transcript_30147/g.75332 Transcript_30147/m.75332 type:complete len:424 (+) Transcript_30147:27-1298(+)